MQTLWIRCCGILYMFEPKYNIEGLGDGVSQERLQHAVHKGNMCTDNRLSVSSKNDKLLTLWSIGFYLQIHPSSFFFTVSDAATAPELKCSPWMTVDCVAGMLGRHSNRNMGITVGEGPTKRSIAFQIGLLLLHVTDFGIYVEKRYIYITPNQT